MAGGLEQCRGHVGQSLLATMLTIQSNSKHSGAVGTLREDLENRLRRLVDDVHRLAWGMRPAMLDDYGLDSALGCHVVATSRRTGIAIDYECRRLPDGGRLPDYVEITLYRIAQEAIANVVCHSEAGRASIVLLQQPQEAVLLVEDNGRGFDPASVRKDTCLGLTGMKERVALLGGACDIESAPGRGATIRVRIPLEEEAECISGCGSLTISDPRAQEVARQDCGEGRRALLSRDRGVGRGFH